jgi:hypothetical protein
MATIVDENESQFKKEDLDRSNAIAADEIPGYASSWQLWGCSLAISFATTG